MNAPSMNKKMAASDALAVSITAIAMDQAKDFDSTRVKVIEIATELRKFVDTGNFSDLPSKDAERVLIGHLASKGWSSYSYIVDSALAYVKTKNVNVDKIGVNNVELIKIALDGVIRQATRGKSEWAVSLLK